MSAATPLIAVTGGTGFVGRHMISALLERGYQVRALARTPAKLFDLKHDNLEILQGSLGSNDEELVDGADVVLHMAGLIKARTRSDIMAVKEAYRGKLSIIRAPAVFGPGDDATKPFFDFIGRGRQELARA